MTDVPQLFRVTLQVSDVPKAAKFYAKLLGVEGRDIRGSTRHYLDCGPVILGLIDPSAGKVKAKPSPDITYFSVKDLAKVHARAKALKCLSKEDVHGDAGGEMVKRPWGERSFYCVDPWGNELCFVDAKTVFTGK